MSSIRSPWAPPRPSQVWLKWCRNRCGHACRPHWRPRRGDHLVDPAGGHRPAVADAQPQLRSPCLRVPGAGTDVAVQGAGGVVPDRDYPFLAALAAYPDRAVLQVNVAALGVVRAVADPGDLPGPDPCGPEHRDHRRVAALRERSARAGALDTGQILVMENRDGLFRDVRRLQPGRRVGDLFLAGQPFEELLQGAVLVAGVRAAVAVQQPCHPLLHVPPGHLPPGAAGSLLQQVLAGEPLHCLGVGAHRLGGLLLGG